MLIDSSSISAISVNSKNKSSLRKASPSTSIPDSPQHKPHCCTDFQSTEDYWCGDQSQRKARELTKTIAQMEQHQQEMEKRFQQYIQSMLAEIEKNNENNNRLALEVNRLKTEVSESKKDILIIEEFMGASQKKTVKKRGLLESVNLGNSSSERELFGSVSISRNILGRRTASKFFKSKLLMKG